MELSEKDRLFIINQYRILSFIDPSSKDFYEELITILSEGYEIFYSSIFDLVSYSMSYDKSRFVLDVLNIYRAIEEYKRNNNDKDINNHNWSYFRGFDGNDEGEYLGFTLFLIKKQNKYSEQKQYFEKNDECNSHHPTLGKYGNMINIWKKYKENYPLNKEQILEIINADNAA